LVCNLNVCYIVNLLTTFIHFPLQRPYAVSCLSNIFAGLRIYLTIPVGVCRKKWVFVCKLFN